MEMYFNEMCLATGYHPVNESYSSIWNELVSCKTIKSVGDFRKKYMDMYCKVETYKECTEIVLMLNWASWAHAEVSKNAVIGRACANEFYKAQNALYRLSKDNKEISNYIFVTLD